MVLTVIQSQFWIKEEEGSLHLSPGRDVFTAIITNNSLKDEEVWSSGRFRVRMKFMRPL